MKKRTDLNDVLMAKGLEGLDALLTDPRSFEVIQGGLDDEPPPPPGDYAFTDGPPPYDAPPYDDPPVHHGPSPEGSNRTPRAAGMALAEEGRALLAAATLTLGADLDEGADPKVESKARRQRIAQAFSACVEPLAWLRLHHGSEWAAGVATLLTYGGLSAAMPPIERAVRDRCEELREQVRAANRAAAMAKPVSDATTGPHWPTRERLSKTDTGQVKPTFANAVTILRNDPRWETLRMSRLGNIVEFHSKEFEEGPGTATASEWLRDNYGADMGEVTIKSAIYSVAQGRAYSPVVDYLESVRGKANGSIARILPEILGLTHESVDGTPDTAEDIPTADLRRKMIRRFLIGSVARAYKPGCKMDTALVLGGEQAAMKSSFLKALFGEEFFGDSPLPVGNKDAPIQMSRAWGYEAAELEDLTSKRSSEAVKAFMSTARDLYRPPFARTAIFVPRHTSLCGSFNPRGGIFTDETGSRRFWIIDIPKDWTIRIDILKLHRDAIWAEALAAYEAGERWWFDRDEDRVREEGSQRHVEEDPWQGEVEKWLDDVAHKNDSHTLTAIIMGAIKIDPSEMDRRTSTRMRAILHRVGWKEHASPAGFRNCRVWRKIPNPGPPSR